MSKEMDKILELEQKRKAALKNAARQRRKQILAQGTNKFVRVRPEFWEQVARGYADEICKLKFKYVNHE
jgi:hypothetical protein